MNDIWSHQCHSRLFLWRHANRNLFRDDNLEKKTEETLSNRVEIHLLLFFIQPWLGRCLRCVRFQAFRVWFQHGKSESALSHATWKHFWFISWRTPADTSKIDGASMTGTWHFREWWRDLWATTHAFGYQAWNHSSSNSGCVDFGLALGSGCIWWARLCRMHWTSLALRGITQAPYNLKQFGDGACDLNLQLFFYMWRQFFPKQSVRHGASHSVQHPHIPGWKSREWEHSSCIFALLPNAFAVQLEDSVAFAESNRPEILLLSHQQNRRDFNDVSDMAIQERWIFPQW